MLKVEHLFGGYTSTPIVKDISFEVQKGELFGILGPNGSGKTTLLKMLSGVLPFQDGAILIKGRGIHQYTRKELAKMIGVLSQHSQQAFSYTVKETVSLGRYAHQKGWFKDWSEEDEKIVQKVMAQTGVASFHQKSMLELSGGERQRVFLAQALAQEPEILLLDEPTNHLDLSYQKELLDSLKKWTTENDLTVISIFHDLNLAGLYCDRLLLLEKGAVKVIDKPAQVLKEDRIKEVYHTDIEKRPHPRVPVPQLVLLPKWEQEKIQSNYMIVDETMLQIAKEHNVLKSPISLKTMSSGVIGAGTGWFHTFVNRHVDQSYHCNNHREEMLEYLIKNGFDPSDTVGMMTAVYMEDVSYRFLKGDGFSILVIVTAGVGNAVDASMSEMHHFDYVPGTINTWIFVNGELTEEAFIQSIITATETKVKVMEKEVVVDSVTGTIATGTSTDSLLIASTQKGRKLEFAGTITPLGKLISKGVFECTSESIQKSVKRKFS